MQIIVSDSSCLIDLRKASLLEAFLGLPFEIAIPDTLFEDELLRFSETEKTTLLKGGLKIVELPGKGVMRAQELESQFPSLTIHDCFAFSLAEQNPDCILLTGDKKLRSVANDHMIEVHGVLWVIDEIHKSATCETSNLLSALEIFEGDPTVHLPIREVRAFIRRFRTLVES